MEAELALHAARQGGLFTREQARDAGYRGPAIRQRTSPGGTWVVVRRGVYTRRETWDALNDLRERPLAVDRAAHLSVRVDHVLSHDSAARAWDLPFLRPDAPLVHITRPGVGGSRTDHGIKHHLARTIEGPFLASQLPVTGLARTALDIAREHGRLFGLLACDGALRLGATYDEFEAVIASMRSWRHITRVRSAARSAVLGAESPGETLARDLLGELGLTSAVTQFPVETAKGVAWCDLLVGCHVVEFDGRAKYRPTTAGGLATSSTDDVVWQEKVRERDIASLGLGISRVFWNDFFGKERARTLRRLADEHRAITSRYGASPRAGVVAYAERMADARDRRLRRAMLEAPSASASATPTLWTA